MPKFWQCPVVAGYFVAAGWVATITFEFVVGTTIRHGVVKSQFFAGLNIAHGNQTNLTCEAYIGLAGMIEAIIRFFFCGSKQIEVFVNLNHAFGETRHALIELTFVDDITTPKGDQFTFGNGGDGKYGTTGNAFWASFAFRV